MKQVSDFTNNGTALGKACVPADLNKIYSSQVLDAEPVTCLKVSSYGGKARQKALPRLISVIGIGLKPEITAKRKKNSISLTIWASLCFCWIGWAWKVKENEGVFSVIRLDVFKCKLQYGWLLVQDRGSFQHSGKLKYYLVLIHTEGSQDSLPLTDNNLFKCFNVLLQLTCPVPHLVLLTGQAALPGEVSNLESRFTRVLRT